MKKIDSFNYSYDGKNTQLKITIDNFTYLYDGKIIGIITEDKNNFVICLKSSSPIKKGKLEVTSSRGKSAESRTRTKSHSRGLALSTR